MFRHPRRLVHPISRSLTKLYRQFTVLALESSADDTCAAVLTSDRQILSNVVIKQHHLHAEFGGIHPYVAMQGHQRNMPGAVQKALADARLSVSDVDGIAYTRGPGIGGCLGVGSNAAQTLAAALNKPLVGVHHMQAHALTPLLTHPHTPPQFPFLTLLISGGHTLLLLASSPSTFRTLATTADESIGRAYDKVARLLDVGSMGLGSLGEQLEIFCTTENEGDSEEISVPPLPLPMPRRLAFSYASLHSSVERYIRSRGGLATLSDAERRALACAFQHAAVGQLEEKLDLGFKACRTMRTEVRDLVVSGGVASNRYLRGRLQTYIQRVSKDLSHNDHEAINLHFPPVELCTDNAAMIAWASMYRFLVGDHDDYGVEPRAKWDIEEL